MGSPFWPGVQNSISIYLTRPSLLKLIPLTRQNQKNTRRSRKSGIYCRYMNKSERTKESILTAARSIFSEKGFHRTSVADIISAAGMAKGSFYNYFASKNEIFATILENFTSRISKYAETISPEEIVDRESYMKVLGVLGSAIVFLFTRNESQAQIFLREAAGVDPVFDEILNKGYKNLIQIYTNFIVRAQQIGILRNDIPAEVAGAAQTGMITSLLERYIRREFPDTNPEDLMKHIIRIHTEGMMAPVPVT